MKNYDKIKSKIAGFFREKMQIIGCYLFLALILSMLAYDVSLIFKSKNGTLTESDKNYMRKMKEYHSHN